MNLKYIFALLLFSATSSQAEFAINHCQPSVNNDYDCGQSLIGSAFFEPNSISWTGGPGVWILEGAGFSGRSYYLSEQMEHNGIPGDWVMTSHNDYTVTVAEGVTTFFGHFYAPSQIGKNSYPNRYRLALENGTYVEEEPIVEIEGIDDVNVAITVDVKVQLNGQPYCLNDQQCPPCTDGTSFCRDLVMAVGSEVIFTVTPMVDLQKVPASAREPKHALVKMISADIETACNDNSAGLKQAFKTSNISPNNFSDINGYYHYLFPGGPTKARENCSYVTEHLVSFGKSFIMATKNKRPTDAGHALFIFTTKGHFSFQNQQLYPGGHQSFHLKTKIPGLEQLASPKNLQLKKQ